VLAAADADAEADEVAVAVAEAVAYAVASTEAAKLAAMPLRVTPLRAAAACPLAWYGVRACRPGVVPDSEQWLMEGSAQLRALAAV
jgi:predicted NAD/FAD-dependent oxidoreductase